MSALCFAYEPISLGVPLTVIMTEHHLHHLLASWESELVPNIAPNGHTWPQLFDVSIFVSWEHHHNTAYAYTDPSDVHTWQGSRGEEGGVESKLDCSQQNISLNYNKGRRDRF